MDRLTHKARYEAGYKLNKGVKEWQAADRLGAYENTGLTPAEIMELKERDTPKIPIYQVQGDERYEQETEWWECPNCGEIYDMDEDCDFCPNCGQRLLR